MGTDANNENSIFYNINKKKDFEKKWKTMKNMSKEK